MILALGMAAMTANAKPVYTMENTYPRVMAIKEIDAGEDGEYWTEDDIALCIDAVGMKWKFTNPEDLEEGDVIVCTMYDNGTKGTIVDDQMIDIRWSGYTVSELTPMFN